jgi:hypothetical protein
MRTLVNVTQTEAEKLFDAKGIILTLCQTYVVRMSIKRKEMSWTCGTTRHVEVSILELEDLTGRDIFEDES